MPLWDISAYSRGCKNRSPNHEKSLGMSRLGKIARRTFLIGSAAVVGGVAFGVYKYRSEGENPLLDDLGANEAAITPYVKIDANGITLITPRADKGQGAYSIQAALIAEELDVDLDQINVDPGPPAQPITTRPSPAKLCHLNPLMTGSWPKACAQLRMRL